MTSGACIQLPVGGMTGARFRAAPWEERADEEREAFAALLGAGGRLLPEALRTDPVGQVLGAQDGEGRVAPFPALVAHLLAPGAHGDEPGGGRLSSADPQATPSPRPPPP